MANKKKPPQRSSVAIRGGKQGKDPMASIRAARLRAERERRGWEQKELAAHAGLAPSTIHYYEQGRSGSPKNWATLAKVLGVDLAYLLGFQDERRR